MQFKEAFENYQNRIISPDVGEDVDYDDYNNGN
jgi:hypothetical protein